MLVLAGLAGDGWALAPDRAFHHYVKDSWSIEEGLPQITVNAVVQGPDGYIWAATQAGLSRFDGVRFANFSPEDTPQLQGMFLRALFVDSRDRLWIGSYRGAAVYSQGAFRAVDDGFGREYDVFGFAETDAGELLAATTSGLLRLFDDVLLKPQDFPDEPLWSVFHHDGLSVAGGRGVVFHNENGEWRRKVLPATMGAAQVNAFARHDGRLWAGSTRGLLVLDDNEWQQVRLPDLPPDLVVEMLFEDRDENLWIGAAGRLLRLRNGELLEVIDDHAPYALPSVRAAAEDHEGNLWLGSQWSGLSRLWNGWMLNYDRPEGLHNSLVWSVARDAEGQVWTGTLDGLAVFRDGRFRQLTTGNEQPHPHAYTLLPEAEQVWVGTRAGLFVWNRLEERIDQPSGFAPLNGTQVNGIVRWHQDYWLATNDGIWRWDGERMERMADADEPGGRDVRVLFVGDGDKLLAGERNGLLRWTGERFLPVAGAAEGQDVSSIAQSDAGLIVGTMDGRLWFERNGQWHGFDGDDGLPDNSAFFLGLQDNTLWVAGLRGIYELPMAAVDQYLAGEIPVLPGRMVVNERGDVPGAQKGLCCNGAGNARGFMSEGAFWLPTRGGVARFEPEQIVRNPEPPAVHLDRMRTHGHWQDLAGVERLELEAGQRDLNIGIAVLSYQHPDSVQIEYRLEGYQPRWLALDDPGQRQLFYTNLPTGELALEVRATNNAGVWSTEPARLKLSVPPRLWETHVFRALLLFASVLIIWLIFNLRLRKLQNQHAALESKAAERTEALREANERLQEYSSRMETVSMSDPLTGSWNRRYLVNQLPADLAHFHREIARDGDAGRAMLFALLDLDRFRDINEQHGHGGGDRILRDLADALREFVRRGDYVVRWGGEQFLVVFRPMPNDEIPGVAERMAGMVRQRTFSVDDGQAVKLTASLGMAAYPPYPEKPGALTWEDTVTLAEKALNRVKQTGRNGWCQVAPTPWAEPATLLRRLDQRIEQLLDDRLLAVVAESDR
ncbi:diguanylate cyclase [Wenzhouxiangella sp. AB-CW3]|uniref:ligand-binding sensor domain-containing diguanylate cyclase n=1 Tax=Wenzhouxiangella sp. AB-CW3 TaxID=2771012 RepID=UPI00168B5FDF|nr:ligand-binding sensor domain-containing diguanylate cyclase [Wenzhouxiangella sp. AB-CW3]QOC23451.1 diguanylate cyclase [Wenzhouxiangella sp. AB-CW3]